MLDGEEFGSLCFVDLNGVLLKWRHCHPSWLVEFLSYMVNAELDTLHLGQIFAQHIWDRFIGVPDIGSISEHVLHEFERLHAPRYRSFWSASTTGPYHSHLMDLKPSPTIIYGDGA